MWAPRAAAAWISGARSEPGVATATISGRTRCRVSAQSVDASGTPSRAATACTTAGVREQMATTSTPA